jgi:hypothetical protein
VEATVDKNAFGRAAMRQARAADIWVLWAKGALLFLGAAGCAGEEVLNPVELSSSSSTSTTSGGGGGGGGGSGSGGEGGTGGSGVACLNPSAFADLFSIEVPDLCAVAIFDAAVDLGGFVVPTWGRHGGPVTVSAGSGGSLEVVRWEVPAGSMGSLTPKTTTLSAGIPADAFPGAQAIDLPFFGWTAVSWGGSFPSTEGEVILAKEAVIEQRYDVQSFFSGVGVAAGPGQGRLLYTALSPLEDPAVSKSALYAADACGAEGDQPRLLPAGDPACGPPIEVAAWGEFSGPVAADRDGNVFAVMSSFSTNDQEARGFAASSVARGEPPAPGDLLFKLSGYGMSLSALAPEAPGGAGLLAFQPSDGVAGPLDVIGQRYRVEGTAILPEGGVETLLKLAKPAISLALLTDANERIWVGCQASGATRFVVLGRAAPP